MNYVLSAMAAIFAAGCVFKIEVPSAKTKLEKQVLGYKPQVDKKKLAEIVTRGIYPSDSSAEQLRELRLRLKNQIIDNLKLGLIGESNDGRLVIMDRSKWQKDLSGLEVSIVNDLIQDENQARSHLSRLESQIYRAYQYRSVDGAWYESEKEWEQYR